MSILVKILICWQSLYAHISYYSIFEKYCEYLMKVPVCMEKYKELSLL